MTPMQQAAMQQALDFVDYHSKYWNGSGEHPQKIVSDLRQALEAEQQTPGTTTSELPQPFEQGATHEYQSQR